MQRGVTLIELLICIAILSIFAGMAIPRLGQSLEKQELENSSRQLAADIRWLQQISINAGVDTTAYAMFFYNTTPYGYYITANTQRIKNVIFPISVNLPGSHSYITFTPNGAPVIGAQSISLYNRKLKQWKYVILAPVTGRVRISDVSSVE
jgi:prepilin-type N-terminal cleavage/methylation domain-containing protein